jgi:hypothetical protein
MLFRVKKNILFTKAGKPLICLLLLVLIFFGIIPPGNAFAQNILEKKLSLEVRETRLSEVLEMIARSERINFSYNPADASYDQLVTYTATNQELGEVLKNILSVNNHDFRLVGSQIVVFRKSTERPPPQRIETTQTATIQAEAVTSPQVRTEEVIIPIGRTDTLIVRDTIIKVDTIIIRDTVIIEREVPRLARPEPPKPLKDNIFRIEPDRNNGWYITGYYHHMFAVQQYSTAPANAELKGLIEDAENPSWVNYSIGAEISFANRGMQYSSGLQYTHFSTPFDYSYQDIQGGFYRVDTVESYYILLHSDTTWYYFTDSVWIPSDIKGFYYSQINRLGYIEVPLQFAFNLYSGPDLKVYLKAGALFGLLINKKGSTISNQIGYPGIDYNELEFNPLVISYSVSPGIRYRINEWFDLNAELSFRQSLGGIIKDHPVTRTINAGGLRLGIIYYL